MAAIFAMGMIKPGYWSVINNAYVSVGKGPTFFN